MSEPPRMGMISAALVLTVTVSANAQQPSEKSIEAVKTSMQQAGRDARKAAQQAKDAIGLALKAAESARNEASKQATETAQRLASDAEAAAKRAEDKVIAANKAAAAAGNEVAQKAEEAANKAVAATKEAAQKREGSRGYRCQVQCSSGQEGRGRCQRCDDEGSGSGNQCDSCGKRCRKGDMGEGHEQIAKQES